MIVGLLMCAIGIIPIVLAISVTKLYKDSNLSSGLLLFMISVSLWQVSVGILYFKDFLNEQEALLLFRFLKFATIYIIPVVFYIAYVSIKDYSATFQSEKLLDKVVNIIFTRKMLIGLVVWSTFIYIIHWTKLGIVGLKVKHTSFSTIDFYFPEYGILSWLYILHLGSMIFFLLFLFVIAKKIHNSNIRQFLRRFSIYTLFSFIIGVFNFNPETGIIAGTIGVITFSVMVIFEFIKLNTAMQLNYYQLIERQKKLDYTGNLAGSLIHEVKNTNIIIKGFSKMLSKDISTLNDQQIGSLDMIIQATEQVEELANNYKEYMKNSKMNFKMEDLDLIIQQSIDFSKEITNENHINVEFINDYKSLKAFANKTYLQQVFINLIKNSSEAIPTDKKDRKITINTDIIDDNIIINFYDTGKGIPPANWESIFDPFISFKDKGMGLGLPFVKKIIFEHRGDIVVVDSTPAGTHFQIKIPQFGIPDIS